MLIQAFIWIISSFFIFLVPGFLMQKYLKVSVPAFARFVLSLALGMALWGAQGFILGYLHVRFLTYLYVAVCMLLTVLERQFVWKAVRDTIQVLFAFDTFSLVLLATGMLLQITQMIGTGVVGEQGMAFWRVNMQDGVYHLSIIAGIVRFFPPREPGFSGHFLINYHYWSDLIFAEQVRIFRIPAQLLFFQFAPWIFSFATGLALIALLTVWKASKLVIRFGLFFLFFGADAGYIASYFIHQVFSFQYPVIDTGVLQFLNMPHVLAKFVFLVSMIGLDYWMKRKQWRWGVITMLLTTILFGLKIYFALYAVLGLACIALVMMVRRDWKLVRQLVSLGICGALVAAAIYLPPNHGSGGLTYVPLAWPNLMLAVGNLDWTQWRYKLAIAQMSHSRLKTLFYDVEAIGVTLIAIHGTRILGFVFSRQTAKTLGGVWMIYLLVPTGIFTVLGLFTMQVSGGYNVYNFFAMSLTLLALLTAYLAADLWNMKLIIGKVIVVVIVLLTLPRVVYETQKIIASYQDHTDVLYISKPEMAALAEVNQRTPTGCLLATSPANELDMKTPYVSFFSNRLTYMSGQSVLETHNQPSLDRYTSYRHLFASQSAGDILSTLRSYGICALYIKTSDENFDKIMAVHPAVYFRNETAVLVKLE